MIFDKNALPAPSGMTFEEMLSMPVTTGNWRESARYVCAHCHQNAFHHPYTNDIWGCSQCGTTTTRIRENFVRVFSDPSDREELPVETCPGGRTWLEPETHLRESAIVSEADQLPEFKVTLTRMPQGEHAVDPNSRRNQGSRTKLGGSPDWIQLNDDTPICDECKTAMTFVAQIDSIEHVSLSNPLGIDFKDRDRSGKPWMFADVGMIYVFYCFNCAHTQSVMQSY